MVAGKVVTVLHHPRPTSVPWPGLKVQLVADCSHLASSQVTPGYCPAPDTSPQEALDQVTGTVEHVVICSPERPVQGEGTSVGSCITVYSRLGHPAAAADGC